jgi:hypothetical protein
MIILINLSVVKFFLYKSKIDNCFLNKKKNPNQAVIFCLDCNMNFCDGCSKFHYDLLEDSHSVDSFKKIKEMKELALCTIHHNENNFLSLYCKVCKKLVCTIHIFIKIITFL